MGRHDKKDLPKRSGTKDDLKGAIKDSGKTNENIDIQPVIVDPSKTAHKD